MIVSNRFHTMNGIHHDVGGNLMPPGNNGSTRTRNLKETCSCIAIQLGTQRSGDLPGRDQSQRMSRAGEIYRRVLLLVLVLVLLGTCRAAKKSRKSDLTRTEDFITQYEINTERYRVTTEDGYHVTMYRLLPPILQARGVVLLQHGIRQSSADWLKLSNNLPMQLLASGLEVWLGNSRASEESVGSILTRNTTEEFWAFSFHEIGYHDLAAMIDATLEITRRRKLHLVSYSEGATASLILLSERPSYNAKIASLNLMAPAAYMSNSEIKGIAVLFGHIKPFLQGGFRSLIENVNLLAGNSARELEHYQQLILSGRFRRFDYGPHKNLQKYGSRDPPDYPLHKITVPIVMHYGTMDRTVPVKDIERLSQAFGGSPSVEIIEYDALGHTDFLSRAEAMNNVYPQIVQNVMRLL